NLPGWADGCTLIPGIAQHLGQRAGCACFYAKNIPTQKIPVHSRDAACPRPTCLPASCTLTHPTRLPASCMLTRVLHAYAPHALARILPTCPRPAILPASCMLTHPTYGNACPRPAPSR